MPMAMRRSRIADERCLSSAASVAVCKCMRISYVCSMYYLNTVCIYTLYTYTQSSNQYTVYRARTGAGYSYYIIREFDFERKNKDSAGRSGDTSAARRATAPRSHTAAHTQPVSCVCAEALWPILYSLLPAARASHCIGNHTEMHQGVWMTDAQPRRRTC